MHLRHALPLALAAVLVATTACGTGRPTREDLEDAALPALTELESSDARDAAACLAEVVDGSELSDDAVDLVAEELRGAGSTERDAAQVVVETDLGGSPDDEDALTDLQDALEDCLPLSSGRPSREALAQQLEAQSADSIPFNSVTATCIAEDIYASDISDQSLRDVADGDLDLTGVGVDLRGEDLEVWEAIRDEVLACVPGPAGLDRPTVDEIARSVAAAADPELASESQAYCVAEIVHASAVSDATLRLVVDGGAGLTASAGAPKADALQFEALTDELTACLTG